MSPGESACHSIARVRRGTTKMSRQKAGCWLPEVLQLAVLQTRGVYLRTSWLVPRIGRQGRIIWMMKNAVQRHWTSFFCAGMWPGDKNCHATRWWARALRGEVSGVENRQVVSPPVRTNVWLGRSPHPIRQGSAAQGSHRASVQPSESPYSHPAGGSPARAPRHWRGDPNPTWQGFHPAGSIAQGSHRATFSRAGLSAPSHPVGGCRVGRTFSRAGLPGVSEHPRPDASWSADENLDNFGAGAVN